MILLVAICSVITSACVVYQSRLILRMMRENTALRNELRTLYLEAVWPAHEPNGP